MDVKEREYRADPYIRAMIFLFLAGLVIGPQALLSLVVVFSGIEKNFADLLYIFLGSIVLILELPLIVAFVILLVQLMPAKLVITDRDITGVFGLKSVSFNWDQIGDFEHEFATIWIPLIGTIFIQVFEIRSGDDRIRFVRHSGSPGEAESHWLKVLPFFSYQTWNLKRFGVPVSGAESVALLAEIEERCHCASSHKQLI